MVVNSLKIKNYRNFAELHIDFDDVLNIFIGDNGQGKTNLLESVYLCSIGRTFRLNSESDLIRFGENKSEISLSMTKDNQPKKIDVVLEKNKSKQVRLNGVKLDKTSEMIGYLSNVIFTPDDMKIIKGSPAERRKFINIDISQIKPKYKYLLKNYNKIVIQRNNLLKSYGANSSSKDVISIWNDYMVNMGTELIYYRAMHIDAIRKYAENIYSDISGNREKFSISYRCDVCGEADMTKASIKAAFEDKLKKGMDRELRAGMSMYGPHKDDLSIKINGKEFKYFGSQGQQRSAVLALKLAEIEIIKEEIGEYPVLLLDDVLSELDSKRKKYLLEYIRGIQTIITTTDDNEMNDLVKSGRRIVYYINEGRIGNIKD